MDRSTTGLCRSTAGLQRLSPTVLSWSTIGDQCQSLGCRIAIKSPWTPLVQHTNTLVLLLNARSSKSLSFSPYSSRNLWPLAPLIKMPCNIISKKGKTTSSSRPSTVKRHASTPTSPIEYGGRFFVHDDAHKSFGRLQGRGVASIRQVTTQDFPNIHLDGLFHDLGMMEFIKPSIRFSKVAIDDCSVNMYVGEEIPKGIECMFETLVAGLPLKST